MAKEKYHNNQEITAISQEKTTCRRLHKAIIHIYIYRLVWDPYAWKWNFYRFNKNMETWLVQAEKGGFSTSHLCLKAIHISHFT